MLSHLTQNLLETVEERENPGLQLDEIPFLKVQEREFVSSQLWQ